MIRKIIGTFFSSCLLIGCLKDKPITDMTISNPVIIIPNANRPSTAQIATKIYLQSEGTKTINLYARISWDKTLDHDLEISFAKDVDAIAAYNIQFNKNYLIMPENGYSMPGMKLIIPAGQRDGFIPVVINPASLSPSDYILSFVINNAQGKVIASNFKTILYPIRIVQ